MNEEITISKRTYVLMVIYEHQKETGEGISYPELVHKSGLLGVSEKLVSKSFDSLMDGAFIEDRLINIGKGGWGKRIYIPHYLWDRMGDMHKEYLEAIKEK